MSNIEEDSKFKYYISIWFENKESYKVINEAIGVPGTFDKNDLKKSKSQKYTTDNYEIFLEDDFLEICFPKIDIKFIKSIVNPICIGLKINEIDYPDRIFHLNSDKFKYINLLSAYDEYPDEKDYDEDESETYSDEDEDEWETDADEDEDEWESDEGDDTNYDTDDDEYSNDTEYREKKYKKNNLSNLVSLDPEDDCLEDEEKEKDEDEDEDNDEYHYIVYLDLIDGMAYRRIADAIGVFDAFPRIHPDTFEEFGENNYGKYKCDKFIIDIDYNQAEIKFKELDIPYIKSIMNKITDSLLYPRDEYELFDEVNDEYHNNPIIFE